MTKIEVRPDCGNAPKKQVLRDYLVAFVEGDVDSMLSVGTDDIRWEIVGRQEVGREQFPAVAAELLDGTVRSLALDTILTHGDEASASGRIEFTGGRAVRFCDVFKFRGHSKTAKLERVTSYWIDQRPHAP